VLSSQKQNKKKIELIGLELDEKGPFITSIGFTRSVDGVSVPPLWLNLKAEASRPISYG
jgi:hypothetical protein